jgi:hypothetical protein
VQTQNYLPPQGLRHVAAVLTDCVPAVSTCCQDTARFIALAGTEFTGIDALPETVVDPTPAAEQTGYRNPYEVYGETPMAAAAQLADAPGAAASPKRRASSPTGRCVNCLQTVARSLAWFAVSWGLMWRAVGAAAAQEQVVPGIGSCA